MDPSNLSRIFLSTTASLVIGIVAMVHAEVKQKGWDQFELDYEQWQFYIAKPGVSLSSRTQDYIDCPPYRAMEDLGSKALPFLVDKMRQGQATGWRESQFFLWHAVKKISGVDLSEGKTGVSEQEMASRYIRWWDRWPKQIPQ